MPLYPAIPPLGILLQSQDSVVGFQKLLNSLKLYTYICVNMSNCAFFSQQGPRLSSDFRDVHTSSIHTNAKIYTYKDADISTGFLSPNTHEQGAK